jgi:hypothetical protein
VPGVIAVLTGGDAEGDGLQPIPHRPVPANPHEVPMISDSRKLVSLIASSNFATMWTNYSPRPFVLASRTRHVSSKLCSQPQLPVGNYELMGLRKAPV